MMSIIDKIFADITIKYTEKNKYHRKKNKCCYVLRWCLIRDTTLLTGLMGGGERRFSHTCSFESELGEH